MSDRTAVKLTYKSVAVAPVPKVLGTAVPKNVDETADALKSKLGAGVVKAVEKSHKGDPFVVVEGSRIVDVLRFLRDDERFYCTNLNVVSAVDYPPATQPSSPRMEVVYVVSSYAHRHQIMVKVQLDRDNAKLPSAVEIYRSANWYERECFDMMGVTFEGHPNHARILLPPDWVGYPLRKDYVFPEEYNGMKVPL